MGADQDLGSPPPKAGATLTADQLALATGAAPEVIDRLVREGLVHPAADGQHELGDIARVRLARAFAEGGIDVDAIAWAVQNKILFSGLDFAAALWPPDTLTGRSYREFSESLDSRASLLPSVYAAFGLAEPEPETPMRRDEEDVVASFVELWSMVADGPEVILSAARIAGDGVRRINAATEDLFEDAGGTPPQRLRRGLPQEEATRPSLQMGALMSQLLVWLWGRHSEHEVVGRVVDHVERELAKAGRRERPPDEPPAIAFVDLASYTELTQRAGDERAAQFATSLQALAEGAARRSRGRVVKLLGDGVMLRYPSARSAVESVLALMDELGPAGLPMAHAGIAAGPIVTRDGDVYGHTVNLAARIAAHAPSGELLLPADAGPSLVEMGFQVIKAGEAALKGIDEPVRLIRVAAVPPAGTMRGDADDD